MTAQRPDLIRIDHRELSIQYVHLAGGEGLFDPASLGWQTASMSSACWRGYRATYAVLDGRLLLEDLSICFAEGSLPGAGVFFELQIDDAVYPIRKPHVVFGQHPDAGARRHAAALDHATSRRATFHGAGILTRGG